MTTANVEAWNAMVDNGMSKDVRLERIIGWARMLEERVADLDTDYMAYPWSKP